MGRSNEAPQQGDTSAPPSGDQSAKSGNKMSQEALQLFGLNGQGAQAAPNWQNLFLPALTFMQTPPGSLPIPGTDIQANLQKAVTEEMVQHHKWPLEALATVIANGKAKQAVYDGSPMHALEQAQSTLQSMQSHLSDKGLAGVAKNILHGTEQAAGLLKVADQGSMHALIQDPIDGIKQLTNYVSHKVSGHDLLPKLEIVDAPKVKPNTPEATAATVGGAAGTAGSFIITQELAAANLLKVPAVATVWNATRELPLVAKGVQLLESAPKVVQTIINGSSKSASIGGAYSFVFTPSDPAQGDILCQRAQSGLASMVTFGGQHAMSGALHAVTEAALPAARAGIAALIKNVSIGAGSGLVAGVIDAEAKSILSGKSFADLEKVKESAMAMGVTSVVLDLFRAPGSHEAKNERVENRESVPPIHVPEVHEEPYGRRVVIDGQETKLTYSQQIWMYGKRDPEAERSWIKLHISTVSPEDLGKLQSVIIKELGNDQSEIAKLVGGWKTFDPNWGVGKPGHHAKYSPGKIDPENGELDPQMTKGFTLYVSPEQALILQAKLDSLLVKSGLRLDQPLTDKVGEPLTGDKVLPGSNRVGIVRDTYAKTRISDGARPTVGYLVDQEIVQKVNQKFNLKAGEQLSLEQRKTYETHLGLRPGSLQYDNEGRLALKAFGGQDYHGGWYADESEAGKTFGDYSDRPALYRIANDNGLDPAAIVSKNNLSALNPFVQ